MRNNKTRSSLLSIFYNQERALRPRKMVFILLGLMVLIPCAQGINIILTGSSWVVDLDIMDLEGGAGSDFISTYESPADQITLEVKNIQHQLYEVDVRKVDINWPSQVRVFVRRTSNGTGYGAGLIKYIAGGTSYMEVTGVDQQFFWGLCNRRNIDVQLKLEDVTVDIIQSEASYTTTIIYTAVQVF